MSLFPANNGFCVKLQLAGSERVFINVWGSPFISAPIGPSGDLCDFRSRGLGSARVPLDIGQVRTLKKAERVVDVVVSECLFQGHGAWVQELACLAVREVSARLFHSEAANFEFLRDITYKGDRVSFISVDDDGVEHEKLEGISLPSTRSETVETFGANAAPAIKRGFLNKRKTSLYPSGSNEGRLPPGAGDPLGWLPAGLRNRVHVVPQGQQPSQTEPILSTSKQHEYLNPTFEVDHLRNILTIRVLGCISSPDLEISTSSLDLGGKRWALPRTVNEKEAKARFSKKKQELLIELRLAQ